VDLRRVCALPLRRAAGALLVLSFVACSGGSKASSPAAASAAGVPQAPPKPRVVIISVDGLRPDAIVAAGAANIQALAHRGAYTWRAQTILPSITLPSHASMLSGFPPSVHGITWNDYDPAKGPCRVPTVFAVAHGAGLHTVMVVGKEKFMQLDIPGSVDRVAVYQPDDEMIASGAVSLMSSPFDLMFVHLPETDLNGHRSGWMSRQYIDAVAGADRAVGALLGSLPANTTVILTADHGGHEQTHGSNAAVDMTIPWIVAGPRVVEGKQLAARVSTMDTAATAAHVLGLSLSPTASGRPVMDAFVPTAISRPPMALFVR
jgi:predicted AlkP superfamily pyrophosphatase or phosphodiesterase